MLTNSRKAFTMIEVIFVVVIIGILAAVALPRFGGTAESAHFARAESTLAAVRMSIATERQKRILKGDAATNITDLGAGGAGNAFDIMNAAADGTQARVLQDPVPNCAAGQRACWIRNNAGSYTYRFLDAAIGNDGQADFVLNGNRFDCAAADTADCDKVE